MFVWPDCVRRRARPQARRRVAALHSTPEYQLFVVLSTVQRPLLAAGYVFRSAAAALLHDFWMT